jgi:Ca2+-binding EF-hand superfamily protein
LAVKLVSFFFAKAKDKNKLRFMELFSAVNTMLDWTPQEQLGFCFYLFDHNEDGFICIEDLFLLLRELNDLDDILREDVNKLIAILREKGKRLRKISKISPIIYGIYNKYES